MCVQPCHYRWVCILSPSSTVYSVYSVHVYAYMQPQPPTCFQGKCVIIPSAAFSFHSTWKASLLGWNSSLLGKLPAFHCYWQSYVLRYVLKYSRKMSRGKAAEFFQPRNKTSTLQTSDNNENWIKISYKIWTALDLGKVASKLFFTYEISCFLKFCFLNNSWITASIKSKI